MSFRDDIAQCEGLINQVQGPQTHGTKWYRPPNGVMNAVMRRVLKQEGYRVALGDCYSADPQVPDPGFHTKLLTQCAQDGSVVILHSPEPGIRRKTLHVLQSLVENLRAKLGSDTQFIPLTGMFPLAPAGAGRPG